MSKENGANKYKLFVNDEYMLACACRDRVYKSNKKLLSKYKFKNINKSFSKYDESRDYALAVLGCKFTDVSIIKNGKELDEFRTAYVKSGKKSNNAPVQNTKNAMFWNFTESGLRTIFSDNLKGIAFCDGSSKGKIKGYGFVIICNGTSFEESGNYTGDPKDSVASELTAAEYAISRALALGIKSLILCYDCQAIEDAVRINKPTNKNMARFQAFYMRIKEIMPISFIKVKSHSDVPMNDKADQLASLEMKTQKGDSYHE